MQTIEIEIPDGLMNVGVANKNNILFADTNNSRDMKRFKKELPSGKWKIYSISDNIVTLQEC